MAMSKLEGRDNMTDHNRQELDWLRLLSRLVAALSVATVMIAVAALFLEAAGHQFVASAGNIHTHQSFALPGQPVEEERCLQNYDMIF
nr:hypothetical protein Iba_chr12aCG0950 [Ipomoea batatas]